MANFDERVGRIRLSIDRFEGLDRSAPLCGSAGSFELRNFRLMSDGSLQRREGYAPFVTLEGKVRGVFSTRRQGKEETYAVAGAQVYFLEQDGDGVSTRELGTLSSEQGEVSFVCYDGAVLLLDGKDIWTLTPEGISPMQAYVPLYGEGWEPYKGGERPVKEQPNVLSRQLRLRFVMGNGNTVELGDIVPASVDQVLLDGVLCEGWEYQAANNAVRLHPVLTEGTVVEVWLSLPTDTWNERSSVSGAARADVIGDAQDSRVVFYGGSVKAGCVCMTRTVDAGQQRYVQAHLPGACMLYLTQDDIVTVGDGIHAVTGACRHFDRSLIFTQRGTFMTDGSREASGALRLLPVNDTLGCTSMGGACVAGNDPLSVFGRRVLRWTSRTDERDECNALCVSEPVRELLPEDFGQTAGALCHPARDEVWFYCPDSPGRVFVRQQGRASWTTFDGFTPAGLFTVGERMGYYADRTLFLFDEHALTDTDAQGISHPIEAEYRSSYLDLGHVGRDKRMCGGTVRAQGAAVEMILQTVRGRTFRLPLSGQGDAVDVMQRRARVGRFRYLRVGVRSACEGPLRVWGVQLTARG